MIKRLLPYLFVLPFFFSCDIMEEDIEIDTANLEDPIALVDNSVVGIPLLNGDITLAEFVEDEGDENLKTNTDGFYYIETQSDTTLSGIDFIAESMGYSSADKMMSLPQVKATLLLSQINMLTYFQPVQPDIQLNLSPVPSIKMAYEAGSNLLQTSLPVILKPSKGGYDFSLGYAKFERGTIRIEIITADKADQPDVYFKGARTDENTAPYSIKAQLLSGANTQHKVYEINLSGQSFDLWDKEKQRPQAVLPAIFIAAHGKKLSIADLNISEDNHMEAFKMVVNQTVSSPPSFTIDAQDMDIGLHIDALDQASVSFNPDNPMLKAQLQLTSSLGVHQEISLEAYATYNDGTREVIELLNEQTGSVTQHFSLPAVQDINTPSRYNMQIKDLHKLIDHSPDRSLEKITMGGKIKVVSPGRDQLMAGEEIYIHQDMNTLSHTAVYVPVDVKVSNLAFEIDVDGPELNEELPKASSGSLLIETTNRLPLDIGLTLEVTGPDGEVRQIPVNEGKPIAKGKLPSHDAPALIYSDTPLDYELLDEIIKSSKLNLRLQLNSPDTDGDGYADLFSQLNAHADAYIKAGIKLHIKEQDVR